MYRLHLFAQMQGGERTITTPPLAIARKGQVAAAGRRRGGATAGGDRRRRGAVVSPFAV